MDESEQGLIEISGCQEPKRVADLVFVHGLDGHPKSTWHPDGNPGAFWPKWIGDDFPEIGVWSFGYQVHASAWNGDSMPLSERAINMLDCFDLHDIGSRPIGFVCHSMGGLLIKQAIRHAHDSQKESPGAIAKNTKLVVFLSTPHSGSNLATWLGNFKTITRANVSVDELQAHNPGLRDLNLWYRNNVKKLQIESFVYFEKRTTRGVLVVDPTTADPGIVGVTPIPIDEDHQTICKLTSKKSQIYQRVSQLIERKLTLRPERLEKSFPAVESDTRDTATLTVATALFTVSMNIERDFTTYSAREKAEVLRRIQEILEMGSPPDATFTEGSVIVEIVNLTLADIERLQAAYFRGELADLGVAQLAVIEQIVGDTPSLTTGRANFDIDPVETSEWIDSFNYILMTRGPERARFVLDALQAHAQRNRVYISQLPLGPFTNERDVEIQEKVAIAEFITAKFFSTPESFFVQASELAIRLGTEVASNGVPGTLIYTNSMTLPIVLLTRTPSVSSTDGIQVYPFCGPLFDSASFEWLFPPKDNDMVNRIQDLFERGSKPLHTAILTPSRIDTSGSVYFNHKCAKLAETLCVHAKRTVLILTASGIVDTIPGNHSDEKVDIPSLANVVLVVAGQLSRSVIFEDFAKILVGLGGRMYAKCPIKSDWKFFD